MLNERDKAPDFSLQDDSGKEVSLRSLKGKKVVIYFYPKDDTPGCTKEACGFRDSWKKFEKAGIAVYGVSKDSIESHQKFKNKYSLPFPLLSDPENTLAKSYGAWGEKNMYGRKTYGIIRSTFIIDESGTIQKIYPKVKPEGHAEEVWEAIS